MTLYPEEILTDYDDDGTMPANVDELRQSVVGHKIIAATPDQAFENEHGWTSRGLKLTLDNGHEVFLGDTSDCCAYTNLKDFFLDPSSVDHVITGVGTTEEYTVWHVYADWGDILRLTVGWSPGNPFYYGYGFDIHVIDPNQPEEQP